MFGLVAIASNVYTLAALLWVLEQVNKATALPAVPFQATQKRGPGY